MSILSAALVREPARRLKRQLVEVQYLWHCVFRFRRWFSSVGLSSRMVAWLAEHSEPVSLAKQPTAKLSELLECSALAARLDVVDLDVHPHKPTLTRGALVLPFLPPVWSDVRAPRCVWSVRSNWVPAKRKPTETGSKEVKKLRLCPTSAISRPWHPVSLWSARCSFGLLFHATPPFLFISSKITSRRPPIDSTNARAITRI
jgi:hypothetical protein